MDAGNSGRREGLRKTFFASRRAERHAIQQNLMPRSAEQQTAATAFIERSAQLFPSGFKLRGRTRMPKLIKAGKLQQNVQAANKCACRRSCVNGHNLTKVNQRLARPPYADGTSYTRVVAYAETSLVIPIVPISITFSAEKCGKDALDCLRVRLKDVALPFRRAYNNADDKQRRQVVYGEDRESIYRWHFCATQCELWQSIHN